VPHDGPSRLRQERAIRLWERDESNIQLLWTRRADGMPLTTPLVWQTMHAIARPPTPLRAYPPPHRDTGRGRGGTSGPRRCTSTPKTKVRLVGRISSRICRAIVVVLIFTVRIVNVWYPHARPPLSSQR